MQAAALDMVLGGPDDASSGTGYVLLQQEAWDPYIGRLTKMQTFAWLSKIIFQTATPTSYCPPAAPGFAKTVYAFPSDPGLRFQIGASNGNLVPGPVEILDYSELVQVNLLKNPPLKYPAMAIKSYAWENETFNKKGDEVPLPAVRIINKKPVIDASVHGSLKIVYQVYRYTYTLTIQPRDEYQEKKFQSFLWAAWSGGTKFIEIEAPLGAVGDAVSCNNLLGSGVGQFDPFGALPGSTTAGDGELDTDDEEPFGKVSGEDENVDIDYCSQKVL